MHKWIDLVFGFKQRGPEAVKALNTFVHVTYEGAVDIEKIQDPIQRESTIAQIQNFGQTPSRLGRRAFPARAVVTALKDSTFDFSAIPFLQCLTPPLCIVGAPQQVQLRLSMEDTCKVGITGQSDSSVGDMCLIRGNLIGVGKTCALTVPSKRYYRFGGSNNGVSVHTAISTPRQWDLNKVRTIHDNMHRAPITAVKPSRNGQWLVTGCMDSTVRVWKYENKNMKLQGTLCGHNGGKITCIDISTMFGTIVTGSSDGVILVWDLRTLSFLRRLQNCNHSHGEHEQIPVTSVSLNHKNGDIMTLVGPRMTIFDINGVVIAEQASRDRFEEGAYPSYGISTDCPDWMVYGIAAVTGHKNGDIRLWSIDRDKYLLSMRHLVNQRVHSCPITCLRMEGNRQDILLVGDTSGKMSVYRTKTLESLNQKDLATVIMEMHSNDDMSII